MNIDRDHFSSTIASLKKCFDIHKSDKLKEAFDTFCTDFDSKRKPQMIEVISREDIVLSGSSEFLDHNYWVGIDLPLLFRGDKSRKSLVIAGEDPLRNQKDEHQKRVCDDVILSTPFGLHNSQERKHHSHSLIRELISTLVEKGYQIYVTDVFKAWVKGEGDKINFFKYPVILQNSIDCLKSEIETLRSMDEDGVVKVLALGSRSLRALNKIDNLNVERFYSLHPAAREKNFKVKHKNKKAYYEELAENIDKNSV